MDTSEVLHKAADLIEKRGWGSGSWAVESGPLCIEGAIAAAMGIDNEIDATYHKCPAYYAVRAYVGEAPFAWNDKLKHELAHRLILDDHMSYDSAYARARAEGRAIVIETLRAAAVIEESREADAIITAAELVDVQVVSA